MDDGEPQSSILGPLFYTLFTNKLPEVIHDQLGQQEGDPAHDIKSWPAFNYLDEENGSICCYADYTPVQAQNILLLV